jgi:starch phosphorylase
VAVAELMRLLVDVHNLDFDEAWDITSAPSPTPTTRCCPRRWKAGLPLFERLLPRHMQIIYAINSRVLREARKAGER